MSPYPILVDDVLARSAGWRRLVRRSSTCPPKLEERRRKGEGESRNPPSRDVWRWITPIGSRFARTVGFDPPTRCGCTVKM
jgi:hypothetical protein